jgi:PIN domain nuclease of toxin-antitoxin system
LKTAYLDTQVVVWLVLGEHGRIPSASQAVIESAELLISPMVSLELEYLHEIGRLKVSASVILLKLEAEIGLRVCSRSFADVEAVARLEKWTRDPFDRLIVAQAKLNGVSVLITSDEKIRANYINAIW